MLRRNVEDRHQPPGSLSYSSCNQITIINMIMRNGSTITKLLACWCHGSADEHCKKATAHCNQAIAGPRLLFESVATLKLIKINGWKTFTNNSLLHQHERMRDLERCATHLWGARSLGAGLRVWSFQPAVTQQRRFHPSFRERWPIPAGGCFGIGGAWEAGAGRLGRRWSTAGLLAGDRLFVHRAKLPHALPLLFQLAELVLQRRYSQPASAGPRPLLTGVNRGLRGTALLPGIRNHI